MVAGEPKSEILIHQIPLFFFFSKLPRQVLGRVHRVRTISNVVILA
jgi:hypothetical protein